LKSTDPTKALIIRPDTLGDLVLFSPALSRLREAWSGVPLAVVVRRPYLELARLLVPGIDWIPTDIDPFVRSPSEAGAELERLRKAVAEFSPDVVVAACPRRHWLDSALAAAAPGARKVAFNSIEDDPYFGVQMRLALGRKQAPEFGEIAPAAAGEADWERNYGLAEYLLGKTLPHAPPDLAIADTLLARADEILKARGLEPGRFIACAAAGYAHVRIKTWPAERFAATIGWLHREKGRKTLLVGHRGELKHLEAVRSEATGAAEIWIGAEGELPLLAAVLARSEAYFGNATGAMHLAAALGRPVVGVFGGGTWPRFQPAIGRSISLVNPLPCFGCGWDCPFGDAPCVQAVGTADAQQALAEILEGDGKPAEGVWRLHAVPYAVAALMGRTAALARVRTAAHLTREHTLVATAHLAREKDGEIAMLKSAADEKDAEITALKAATDEKDREIESKDTEITSLKAATDEKDSALKAKEADKLSGRRPIEFVCAKNPIVIIDEPQSVDNTERRKRRFARLTRSARCATRQRTRIPTIRFIH